MSAGPGRPRVHPPGTTAAERKAISTAKRAARGMRVREIALDDDTVARLDALKTAAGDPSRGATIARLVAAG